MLKQKKIRPKLKECRHDKCIRLADPEDNSRGFCNKCIQLNTKECNFCLLKDGKDKIGKSKIWDQNLKDVPLLKLILIIFGIGVLGFILGFTIIRLVLKSIAGLVLLLLLIIAIYLIIKYADTWGG